MRQVQRPGEVQTVLDWMCEMKPTTHTWTHFRT